ncbi:MAG TPA: valine--tRNA ligase [Methanotrichaceae archaeon]|nr:valine--tRNA ligase [Methanotrichaceae archaeon]
MAEVSKEYDFKQVEERWIEDWDKSMYYFDWDSKAPQYVIDTPPPYPTGNFHIGNALNWCYMDFVARYKRMRGYNVMFPQGWDCHGLPTEVKVEEKYHITKNQVPRAEFRRYCEQMTLEAIERFKMTMAKLGISTDWSNEYVTMLPEYYVKTQRSFVQMHSAGKIYREDHPVNWCPRCGTAIAFAEVEYDSRNTTLNYMKFPTEDGFLEIATSRPELLPACVAVAVNPEDERYKKYIGKKVQVPLFDYEVPVLYDPAVDTKFGTGVVMICTFGDKQDVRWWVEHDLPLRQAIDREGRMTEISGKYTGMTIPQSKDAITSDMKEKGIIFKQEPLPQNVGLCWRCKTPIEILSERQWFVKIEPEKIVKTSEEIEWIPPHMEVRLKNWADSVEWDWCISRQRIFATPIPVWYCKDCGEPLVAKEEWLPLDPTRIKPPISCKCGCGDFDPEEDVLDTWMDSSISALAVAGWPGRQDIKYPTQLRSQGHDIIRTWAFYTILRCKELVGAKPWDAILVNGMVLGEDGRKMSKSLGNFIVPEEVFEKNGADALRQWAAIGGTPGSDVMFRWMDVTAAGRFQQKLWSIYRFSAPLMGRAESEPGQVDRWLLGELNDLIRACTDAMDRYQFDETLKAIRTFAWDVLADNYIELVKARLYGPDSPEKSSAKNTLYTAIETLARLLAPFTPFISEEIYRSLTGESVHIQSWPVASSIAVDPAGLLIKDIAAAIRRYKAEKGMPLNAPLPKIEVYSDLSLETTDLQGVANASVEARTGAPELETRPVAVKPVMKHIGPVYKDRSSKIIKALSAMPPAEVMSQKLSGSIKVELEKETIELPSVAAEISTETLAAGKAVDVQKIGQATVLIWR